MPEISLQRTLPYSKKQLLDVILSVEHYGEFVPYCERCDVRERSERAGRDIMLAAMSVGVSIFSETFLSRVISDREAGTIQVTGVEGPLNALSNRWVLTERDGHTHIDFFVSFEFKSRVLSMLASSRVESICERILNAFIARADALYGTSIAKTV